MNQNPNYIQFKEQRELGEIISITFKFIRENYKPLLKLLVKTAGPAFVLLIAAVTYYSYSTLSNPLQNSIFSSGNFLISAGILGLTLLLYYAVVNGTIHHYIKSYIANKGEVVSEQVIQGVKHDFAKLFGLGIMVWIIVLFATILFILPGIYVSVPLSLAAAIVVYRNEDVFDSISESFSLIKNNWWTTFFTLFIIWIIVYVISLVFQMPLIIYTFFKAFTSAQEGSTANMSEMIDWIYIFGTVLSSLIQYILYTIPPIAIGFIYFHLNEKQNFTGTYETIDNLGKDD